jgi:hypothetical protein
VKFLTQTTLEPGNCWQTAVACLLDVDAETLPPQSEIEVAAKTENRYAGHFSFHNAMQCYLQKHHGKSYVQIPVWQLAQTRVIGEHVIVGPTVRTGTELPRVIHCVVGVDGAVAWDVHPSRAGLTEAQHFGFLLPTPPDWEKGPDRIAGELQSWREGRRESIANLCCCPACFVDGDYR